MKKVRVLIVDDSSFSRSLIRELLSQDPGIDIAGEATNGREAVSMARALAPDIITMDLEMPVMGGMAAITEIMHSHAIPILVVSSVADAQSAYDALLNGALDVVNKPDYSEGSALAFIHKIKLLSGVAVITRTRPKGTRPADQAADQHTTPNKDGFERIFAIASSTGGPQALAHILPQLPANFPCPILIAQHIAQGFAQGMAEWLDRLSPMTVRLARNGERPQPGTVYLASAETHMTLLPNHHINLQPVEDNDIYHPNCDRLLGSTAQAYGHKTVGIILTGMGKDGAKGMADIRTHGGLTLAQDEASSVIFGMNRVAIESGCIREILPLEAIADRIQALGGRA